MLAKNFFLLLIFTFCGLFIQAQDNKVDADPDFKSFDIKDLQKDMESVVDAGWVPYFKGKNMLSGVYKLKAGATDKQRPHKTDEMYYVISGRAMFKAGEEKVVVSPGKILFVKAEVEHQFYDVKEDLVLLVFFDQ